MSKKSRHEKEIRARLEILEVERDELAREIESLLGKQTVVNGMIGLCDELLADTAEPDDQS